MDLSYHVVVAIIVFLVLVLVPLLGLRVIQTTFRENTVIFMIPYFLVSVIHLCVGLSPVVLTQSVYVMIIRDTIADLTRIKENNHLFFLTYSSLLLLHTIWRATHCNVYYLTTIAETMALITLFPVHFQIDVIVLGAPNLLRYCPALLDILDGVEMTETQLNPINLVWVKIVICLAIVMFYISSLLEIYHLKFPKPTTGSTVPERLKFIQLVSSVVFLVLRLALFARNPHEFVLVVKTIIRVFCHYQMWSNLRREQKIVSAEPTEISLKIAPLDFNNRRCLAFYNIFMGKADDKTILCDQLRDFITLMFAKVEAIKRVSQPVTV